jgi:hypothetical protein
MTPRILLLDTRRKDSHLTEGILLQEQVWGVEWVKIRNSHGVSDGSEISQWRSEMALAMMTWNSRKLRSINLGMIYYTFFSIFAFYFISVIFFIPSLLLSQGLLCYSNLLICMLSPFICILLLP